MKTNVSRIAAVAALIVLYSSFSAFAAGRKKADPAPAPEIVSQWNGARVAFLGDSITEPNQFGNGNGQQVYWNALHRILGLDYCIYAVSGYRTCHMISMAEKLMAERGQDIDCLLVFIGTNDFNCAIEPGEWYTTSYDVVNNNGQTVGRTRRDFVMEGTTVKAELNRFMAWIKHNYPTKQVIFMTPIHRAFATFGPDNVQPDERYDNALGLFIDDYVDIIKELANVWAVPVIDLNSICGLYPMEPEHEQYFQELGRDMLHPNTEGHERMAYSIAYQLLGYPSKF